VRYTCINRTVYVPGDPVTGADGRTENLLAAVGVALAGRVSAAAEAAAGLGGAAPAALVSITGFLAGQTVRSLAATLGLSHAGAVRVVDRLERDGLVERRRGDGDGREVSLVATSEGRAAADRVLDERAAAMAELLAPLDPGERAALTGLLERLLEDMTPDRQAGRRICRLCDIDACGHPDGCPVTRAGARATSRR
jgi:DNA-binding MarR family transcriptional regulator